MSVHQITRERDDEVGGCDVTNHMMDLRLLVPDSCQLLLISLQSGSIGSDPTEVLDYRHQRKVGCQIY